MSTTYAARLEEREAKRALREQQRIERERERQLNKRERSKLSDIIRDELSNPRARECECGMTTRTTWAELREMGAGCKSGLWVCETLAAIRRRYER